MERDDIFQEDPTDRSPLALDQETLLNDQFRIGRVLGVGGFGITYLAFDEVLEMVVAVKEYLPNDIAVRKTNGDTIQPLSSGEGEQGFEYGLERFLQEARTLAKFERHPNIVRVRTFFEENGTAYLVMNFYEGRTLAEYLEARNGFVPEEEALLIMDQVIAGLSAVHEENVLHRDIDPNNVYLADDGTVVLLDFGAARTAVGERTQSMSVVLKRGYAPHEQYHSHGDQGPWTDVYACSATLYRALTGYKPPEAAARILKDDLASPNELVPSLSDATNEAVLEGLAIRPDDRPQSVDEMAELLPDPPEEVEPGWVGEETSLGTPSADTESAAELQVTASHACRLYIDGSLSTELPAEETYTIAVEPGTHRVRAVRTDRASSGNATVTASGDGGQLEEGNRMSLEALMWQDVVSATEKEPTGVEIDFADEDAAEAPSAPGEGGQTVAAGKTAMPDETVASEEAKAAKEPEGPEDRSDSEDDEPSDASAGESEESDQPDSEAEEEGGEEEQTDEAETSDEEAPEPVEESEAPAGTEETAAAEDVEETGETDGVEETGAAEGVEETSDDDLEVPVRARDTAPPKGAVPPDEETPTEEARSSSGETEAPPPGRLHIQTDRPAELFVDGERRIRLVPDGDEDIGLTPGRHRIRVEAEEGPERWEQDVLAEAGTARSLQIELDRTADANRGPLVSAAALRYGGGGVGVLALLLVFGWWALSNEPPRATPDRVLTVTKPVVVDVTANDRDPDGRRDELRIQSAGPVPDSVAQIERVDSTRLRIQPAAAFAGVAQVPYVLADAPGDTAHAHVTLQVPFNGTQQVVTRQAKRPQDVRAMSLAGDGLDVAVAALGEPAVGWVRSAQSGAGRFDSLSVLDETRNGAVDVHTADLTGNGWPDVLSTSLRADAVTWYENRMDTTWADSVRADSAFAPPQFVTTQADGPMGVQAADVDADGDADAIVGTVVGRRLLWYENRGNGQFGTGKVIDSGLRVLETLHVTNLDNDGAPDLLAVSYQDSTISRYEPQSTASDSVRFETGPSISLQRGGPIEVHTADVTGNGWKDVLVGMAGAKSVVLFENRTDTTGTLQFEEGHVLASDVKTVEGIDTGDVEGDGTLDVFAGSFDSDTVVWFENEGEGSFASAQPIATDVRNVLSLEVGDVNGDGTPDVIVASQAGDVVAWYENHLR